MKKPNPKPEPLCTDCGRKAVMLVWKKYPSTKLRKYVCGYHKRSYLTSEYHREELNAPAKVGYLPAWL